MPGASGTLEKGMVSSIEPGVYIPDFGGLRIEDNVAWARMDRSSSPRRANRGSSGSR